MKKNILLLLILAVLGALAYFFYTNDSGSTIASNPYSNFAIEDTASITKILIEDKITGSVTLTRNKEQGGWILNDTYKAKDRSVEICLQAIKNIRIRGTVPEKKQTTIISIAAGSGKKIEIYTDDPDVPEKIWISAGNTSDHHGDYFILDIPGKGISPEPFVVDLPMFAGYLSARFHTEMNDWRFSGIFNYPKLDFKEVSVVETANPQNSFHLKWDGEDAFEISNPDSGSSVSNINLSNAREYLLRYKKIHLETYKTNLTQFQTDSVLSRTPDWKVSVLNSEDKLTELSMFYLPGEGRYQDKLGNIQEHNQDIMYGTLGDGELFRVQYTFVIKPLLEPISFFRN